MAKFLHICEVCDVQEILETEEAFNAGWDYPPRMYPFGIISPRTCPKCPMDQTIWWAVTVEKKNANELTSKQLETLERISKEPESILVKE